MKVKHEKGGRVEELSFLIQFVFLNWVIEN